MGGAQALQPGDVGFEPGFLHQTRVARRDRLGHRELVGLALAHVLQPADRGVAGKCGGDEAGLALVVLPHGGIERALRRIGEDIDLVMLIALPADASLPLLDLRGQPGHVKVMQGLEAQLGVDAGAHGFRRADQEPDLAGIDVSEQTLLGLRASVILHEGDFRRRNAPSHEFVPDPAIGREPPALFHADRAEIGEDHLRGTGQLKAIAIMLAISVL